jgi:hypothetical protein
MVRMRALRTWRNDQHEGYVDPGHEFTATEQRARDLELSALAERIMECSPRVVVHEDPAWGLTARPAVLDVATKPRPRLRRP